MVRGEAVKGKLQNKPYRSWERFYRESLRDQISGTIPINQFAVMMYIVYTCFIGMVILKDTI